MTEPPRQAGDGPGGSGPDQVPPPGGARWGDLGTRVGSGLAMAVVGGGAAIAGGGIFAALAVVVTGLMIWELAAMTAPGVRPAAARQGLAATALGLLAAGLLGVVFWRHSPFLLPLLLLPGLVGALLPRRLRLAFFLYATAIMFTGYGLVAVRAAMGLPFLLWLLLVVIASDVLGYFAGRALGGPKFWPAISPKKTWSGTVAGWIGAALVGAGFVLAGAAGWGLVLLSPFVAFAGQLGDIAESWLKRRTGVKDSSRLIPGHGGVLDRFDALIGAVLLLQAVAIFRPLPLIGG